MNRSLVILIYLVLILMLLAGAVKLQGFSSPVEKPLQEQN
jgi:hypothetical protein